MTHRRRASWFNSAALMVPEATREGNEEHAKKLLQKTPTITSNMAWIGNIGIGWRSKAKRDYKMHMETKLLTPHTGSGGSKWTWSMAFLTLPDLISIQ